MSRPRIEAHQALVGAMELAGYTSHVYYQPPESIKLVYPCIVYNREKFDTRYSNNKVYKDMTRYTVTVMDKNAESPLADVLRDLQYCEMDREFTSENIHHFVFTLFY